jgi:hypothetical protein
MRLAIQRLSYSRNPWRLVDLDGEADHSGPQQVAVTVRFDHPTLGPTVIDEAVSGQTKSECMESVLTILGTLITLRKKEIQSNDERTAGQRS